MKNFQNNMHIYAMKSNSVFVQVKPFNLQINLQKVELMHVKVF